MNQFGSLLLDRGDNLRMTMAGGYHGDAGRKVEELIAVHVFDHCAAAFFGDKRIIARVRGRENSVVAITICLAFGPGNEIIRCGNLDWRSVQPLFRWLACLPPGSEFAGV